MDLEEGSAQEAIFGDGELPLALAGANWGAFLLGGLWALLHGLWGWFAAILTVRFGLIVLGLTARRMGLFDIGVSEQAFSMMSTLLSWGLYAIFALKANSLAWGKAGLRLSRANAVPSGRITVSAYLRTQKTLLLLGVALLVLGTLVNAQSVIQGTTSLVPFLTALGVVGVLAAVTQLVDHARRVKERSS